MLYTCNKQKEVTNFLELSNHLKTNGWLGDQWIRSTERNQEVYCRI